MTSLRHASVAPRQSSRFLPGSVLVQVQPGARLRVRPTGEVPAPRAEPGEFDSHDPLHACALFACADTRLTCFAGLRLLRSRHVASRYGLSSAVERRSDVPEIAGSTPAVRTKQLRRVLPEARNPVSHSGKHGFESHTRCLMAPSSNGSGSEFTNLRMVVRVHPESLC